MTAGMPDKSPRQKLVHPSISDAVASPLVFPEEVSGDRCDEEAGICDGCGGTGGVNKSAYRFHS